MNNNLNDSMRSSNGLFIHSNGSKAFTGGSHNIVANSVNSLYSSTKNMMIKNNLGMEVLEDCFDNGGDSNS